MVLAALFWRTDRKSCSPRQVRNPCGAQGSAPYYQELELSKSSPGELGQSELGEPGQAELGEPWALGAPGSFWGWFSIQAGGPWVVDALTRHGSSFQLQ